jgi:aminoglycoside 6'-N-acetyltransferase I
MLTSLDIQRVGFDAFEEAIYLLKRFFHEEGFAKPAEEMRSSLHAMITASSCAVFIARRGKEAVGVATVTTSLGIEYGRSAELEDLYVLPKARRSGVASALVEAVCRWCCDQGVSVLLVTVTPAGAAEHKLLDYYQRRGFSNTGRLILERALGDCR